MYLIENLLMNWIQLTLPCTIDSSNTDQHQTTLHRPSQQSIKHEARRHRFRCYISSLSHPDGSMGRVVTGGCSFSSTQRLDRPEVSL